MLDFSYIFFNKLLLVLKIVIMPSIFMDPLLNELISFSFNYLKAFLPYLESDVSTPRAERQMTNAPPSAKKRSSGQQASASEETASPVKPRQPNSRAQTASETEEELRAINNSKIRYYLYS